MLAENILKMVSALTHKDIKKLQSVLNPHSTEELKSTFHPDVIKKFECNNKWCEVVVGQCEQVLDDMVGLVDMLLVSGRGVDRPVYIKALAKLKELQTALLEG